MYKLSSTRNHKTHVSVCTESILYKQIQDQTLGFCGVLDYVLEELHGVHDVLVLRDRKENVFERERARTIV